mmetsp:Transcript_3715/g.5039  ORF Transcript_3715/g.5039 Transcript_3715/m.5039 type:complete len:101 (+) Transcript_3715:1406-1708(+)
MTNNRSYLVPFSDYLGAKGPRFYMQTHILLTKNICSTKEDTSQSLNYWCANGLCHLVIIDPSYNNIQKHCIHVHRAKSLTLDKRMKMTFATWANWQATIY